jgi:ribonucleotide reductase beta subunit family protein with ferritin-like domain
MSEQTISSRILNASKTDYESGSLFMGQALGLVDSINVHYPQLYKLYKEMKSKDWDELEFKFASSTLNTEFKTCNKDTYDIMIRTLAWQWEADSVASRSIIPIMAPFCTNSELFYGWQRIADNECLIEGTEVLTPNGWVDLSRLQPGVKVAQYNPVTEETQFVYPVAFIEKDYKGKVYQFSNHQEHFFQVVTPKHRMVKKKLATGEVIIELAKDMDYRKGSANDRISGIASGYVKENFTVLTAFEKLLIAIQADGSISDRYTGEMAGTIPVWFSFSKERKIERLIQICNEANIALIELTPELEDKGNRKARRRFKASVPVIYCHYLKNFNWVDLQDKGRSWCEAFLEEIVQWDGHFTKNTGILHTTSRQAVEVTQAIASLCGMKTHLNIVVDERSENFSNCWRLSWKHQPYVSGQTIDKTEMDYDGKVRCVTVPSGFFVIRYKDCVSVTGNCVHALTYSEIVKNSFDDPSAVLQDVLKVKEAFQRVELISNIFDEALITGCKLNLGLIKKDQDAYDKIFMFVVAMYCLEAVQFMSSFAITFAMAESQQFVPVANAVQKIALDEYDVHRKWDKEVLDIELSTGEGITAFNRNRGKILAVIAEVIKSEMAWNKYTFSEGREHPGLNEEVLNKVVLYYAKDVYEFFRFSPKDIEFSLPAKNPLLFMSDWLDIGSVQTSPQEQKSGNYVLGMVERDVQENERIAIDLG